MQKNLLWKSVLIVAILLVFAYGIVGIPTNFSKQGLLSAMTQRIHLGLDLSGGTHLILQVQVNDAVKVDSDNAVEVLKEQLNKRKIAFSDVSKPDPDNNPDHISVKGVPPTSRTDLMGIVNDRLQEYSVTSGANDSFDLAMKPQQLADLSTLAVTSNPTRTSPVKRGKWILENILGTPPPPPAPDVPELPPTGQLKGTLRQQMEQHRANPSCAACHAKLDPLGFGLENFDAIGGWRTTDNKKPIDSSGVLPDGAKFSGPAELRKVLLGKADQFRHCFAEKLLTFALGRGLEYYDKCAVDEVVAAAKTDNDRFSAVVMAVVRSDPFQKRKGKRSE